MKTSNLFTLCRVFCAPIFFLIYFVPQWLGSEPSSVLSRVSIGILVPLLIFAELTDYWDGSYARKNGEVSDFGKIFDPFADIFLHLSVFTCFVFSDCPETGQPYMPVLCYVLIFYREFAQNFLRMVAAKQGTAIAARKGGKIKTVFYVVSCFFVLAQELFIRSGLLDLVKTQIPGFSMSAVNFVGYGFFTVCVILAYTSFIDYIRNFGSVLKEAVK